ncbi:MAG: AsmA family protein, partial [Terracidiphilus sp.]
MTDPLQGRQRRRRRIRLALAALVAVLLAVLFVPPMVGLNRYKSRITRLIAASLGRPVRLSSVELRLLPWPGFVLSDLSVAEDPAYGAEPVLHAASVTASIRLLSLFRGRLEIDRISVDDASLNLVRSGPGRWNLDPLFRTAAAKAGSAENAQTPRRTVPLPSLQATNSRINIKDGAEKLPFSLVNTDFEFSQESPGDWRIRLRGQPARTDVSLSQEDTGEMLIEASVRRAPALRELPVHLDLEWREAQLGQLARLVSGSDTGWRGDLTGELHLDGTADAARITTRLRATGVHRAEFSPAEPMDFDANCSLVYHYSQRALDNLVCDSPLGDGSIHVTGGVPSQNSPPHLSVELERVPVAAGLDALRTLRSDLPPDLDASGTVSGKIAYAVPAAGPEPFKPLRPPRGRSLRAAPVVEGPLTGSLVVENFELSGAGLSRPLQIPKTVLQPAPLSTAPAAQALEGTASIPAGAPLPLTLDFLLSPTGYQLTVRGQASTARARDIFGAAGLAGPAGLDALGGDPISVDLSTAGPWLPAEQIPPPNLVAASTPDATVLPSAAVEPAAQAYGNLSGTVTVRNANWRADFLASHVEISQATLHLGDGGIRWDPVAFSYGPVKGTASLALPLHCGATPDCAPRFQIRLGNLDAATLQTAILGVPGKTTLLSALIDRLDPSSAPPWPRLDGTVNADSLVLGPVMLRNPVAALRILPAGAEITDFDADLLGGHVHGSGTFERAAGSDGRPAYTLEVQLSKLGAPAVGQLIGQRWSGGAIDANGKIALSGYTDRDLAASAKGTLHFDWRRGAISPKAAQLASITPPIPIALTRFDLWSA